MKAARIDGGNKICPRCRSFLVAVIFQWMATVGKWTSSSSDPQVPHQLLPIPSARHHTTLGREREQQRGWPKRDSSSQKPSTLILRLYVLLQHLDLPLLHWILLFVSANHRSVTIVRFPTFDVEHKSFIQEAADSAAEFKRPAMYRYSCLCPEYHLAASVSQSADCLKAHIWSKLGLQ